MNLSSSNYPVQMYKTSTATTLVHTAIRPSYDEGGFIYLVKLVLTFVPEDEPTLMLGVRLQEGYKSSHPFLIHGPETREKNKPL